MPCSERCNIVFEFVLDSDKEPHKIVFNLCILVKIEQLLPSSAQSQAPAGLSLALISSNTLTTHPPGQVVKTCLIKLVEHSWQPKLSKS